MSVILIGFLASLAAGLATAAGAVPGLVIRRISPKLQDGLLGFAAGVMLSASFFSLILPGLDAAGRTYGGEVTAALVVIGGILLGAAAIWAMNEYAPHEHFLAGANGLGREGPPVMGDRLRKIWLFVIAITIHNFPEGLAVGVSFGGGNIENGIALAVGIGLQNIPEGLAVCVALLGEGYSRGFAFLIALISGLVEPVGGLIGVSAVSLAQPLLPWGLAFAAGAMIYVISHEIIPETHRRGYEKFGTSGLVVGLVVMMFLDVVLG